MERLKLLHILNEHITFKEAEHMTKYQQRKDIFQPNLTINIFGEIKQTFFTIVTTPQKTETLRIKILELHPYR